MQAKPKFVVAAEIGISIRSPGDVSELIGACLGSDGVLLTEADLAADFFDLRTGLAGELFQKLVNYCLRAAIVVPDLDSHGERFRELAREHTAHPVVRFFDSLDGAETWLRA